MLAVLLFLSPKPMAGHRPAEAVPAALDQWGQVLAPTPTWLLTPFSSPRCHLPAFGPGEVAKPLIPLRHHWIPWPLVCSWGEAIPSSLWHHWPLQLESCPSPSPGSYSVLLSCSAGSPRSHFSFPWLTHCLFQKNTWEEWGYRWGRFSVLNDSVSYEHERKMLLNVRWLFLENWSYMWNHFFFFTFL